MLLDPAAGRHREAYATAAAIRRERRRGVLITRIRGGLVGKPTIQAYKSQRVLARGFGVLADEPGVFLETDGHLPVFAEPPSRYYNGHPVRHLRLGLTAEAPRNHRYPQLPSHGEERKDIFDRKDPSHAEMARRLDAYWQTLTDRYGTDRAGTILLPADEEAALRALGYIE